MSIRPIFPADVHLTQKETNRITRRYTQKDLRDIEILRSKMKKRAPKTPHDCTVRIDAAVLESYYDEAEITLFDGIPLKEFDCYYTDESGEYLLQYRISKATNHEGYIMNGRIPCTPKTEVFITEPGEESTPYPEKAALISIDKNGTLVPQYCIFGKKIDRGISKDRAAIEAHFEYVLCVAQNILVVVNWLLMHKTITYKKEQTGHAKVIHSDTMLPSARKDPTPKVLSRHSISFNKHGNATISGNTRLRLTWFWLQAEHIRHHANGTTSKIPACIKGPGRDTPAAQAALEDYLKNNHQLYIVK